MIPPLFAIFAWPLVGLALFKKLTLQQAVIWCILAGYLFLPERGGIDLPLLPPISKATMPSIVAIIMVMVSVQSNNASTSRTAVLTSGDTVLSGWIPKHKLMVVLFFGLLIGEALTVLTNSDRLVYGPLVLPGLSPYDAASRVMLRMMQLLPLLLARKYLATPEQHKTLVVAFMIAGLIYSLPTLWEVRMSPQLNFQIYGLRIEAWIQHVRNDGYRPLVFLNHGLWLSIFMAVCSIAAVSYIRMALPSLRFRAMLASAWLLGTLLLMNSLGGLMIALVLVIPVLFLTGRMQMLIAAALSAVVLVYPMMRGSGLVPIDRVVSVAESISPARARSLEFRVRNEDRLLVKAQQRPFFGWGSWGRNQVYNEEGGNISVTDGAWITAIGSNGWAGYLTRFGLLCVPSILLALRGRRYPMELATAAIVVMLTANLLDLIPNATLTPITWLLAGALMGRLEYDRAVEEGTIVVSDDDPTDDLPAHAGIQDGQLTLDKPVYSRQKTRHTRRTKDARDD